MKNHSFTILLILLMSMISTKAFADASGKCGANLTWTYVEATGTLTISGSGAMYSYHYYSHRSPWYSYREMIKKAVIEEGVTSIGNYAFYDCKRLTSVTIGNSVTSIGRSAFAYTGWYNAQPDGILYLDNWLIGYKGSEPTGEITIKSGTKGVADYAFQDCSRLTSITIPNSVTSIGERAFAGCSGLTSVTIPNSVTSIGSNAFDSCKGLTSVTIPNSVTSIGEGAFDGVDLTTVVSLIENPFVIVGKSSSSRAFSENTFDNATLYVPVGTKEKYQATDGWKDFAYIVEGTPTGIKVIENTQNKNATIYDLNGVRQSEAKRGINILNGKKVVVK